MPEFKNEILPFAKLALDLGVDYGVIKHCSDDELGTLGVDYNKYKDMFFDLEKAEAMSNDLTKIIVKWDKIKSFIYFGFIPKLKCHSICGFIIR